MNREDIFAKLTKVFCDVFDTPSIVLTETTTSDDIEDWDSLAHLTLVAEIEGSFDTKFTIGEIAGIKTVGDILGLLAKKV